MFTDSQKKYLLTLARETIAQYLKEHKIGAAKSADAALNAPCGVFVTLHEQGELRGCIGNMTAAQPLVESVRDMAIASATEDPRFAPLRLAELAHVDIEISVLSPLEKVRSADDIVLGKHGVVVKKGFSSGVFLPQVALETRWSKEEFLSYLCLHKAGIPADSWKDPRTELYVFTAEVFGEKDNA